MGYPVISLEELRSIAFEKKCLIVVASKSFCDEIVSDLKNSKILEREYVCSWYGIQAGIELNIEDKRFPKIFQDGLRQKKDLGKKLNGVISDQYGWFMQLNYQWDAFLVYQPGKVGSKTIYKTLEDEGIEAIHFHWLYSHPPGWLMDIKDVRSFETIKGQLPNIKKRLMQKGNARKLKIITLVRDPVARALAEFMQGFDENALLVDTDRDLLKCAKEYVNKQLEDDYEFQWFDRELKELTDIDIFEYPFDKEQGYVWIKNRDVEILILKMEKMNENEKVVGQFTEKTDLRYSIDNVGDGKHYKYIYQELKHRFSIPETILKKYYDTSKRFGHFYNEEEKMNFCRKWAQSI